MKRGILIAIPAVLVVIIAGLLVAPNFIDWNQYKTQAQAQIKSLAGYDAELQGNISVALLPTPRVYVENVMIKAPQGSANDYLIKLGRLDARLALGALLGGKVELASVELEQPEIALEVFSDGRQNWMTPELQKMTGGNAAPGAAQQGAPSTDYSQSVALKNISITKGTFIYKDASKDANAAPTQINEVNITAEADTLKGPFKLDGSFAMSGQTYQIKAATGAIDPSQSIQINASGNISPLNAAFTYAGVVGTVAPYSAQGETALSVDSLKDQTGMDIGPVSFKGLVTADQNKADIKNAAFVLGDSQFSGDLGATFSPIKVTGKFTSDKDIDLDKFIKIGAASPAAKGGKNRSHDLMPATISIPAQIDASVSFAAHGFVWRHKQYEGVSVLFSKQDKSVAAEVTATKMPGGGTIDAKAALVFGSVSTSKDKTQTYADPSVVISVKGSTKNLQETIEAASGITAPALAMFKTASVDGSATLKPDSLVLKNTSLKLGDDVYAVAGSYAAGGERPKFVADITADKIDFDTLRSKLSGEKNAGNQSISETLKNFSLPFDIDFDIGAQTAKLQGKDIKGLRAQGSYKNNSIALTNLSAQDFDGAAIKASGGISDLKKLDGVDLNFAGQTQDVKGLMSALGMDGSKLPPTLKTASVTASAKGAMDKLSIDANISALDGNLIAKGDVSDPLGAMNIGNLAVQAKAQNLADVIQAIAPGTARYTSLEKPLDAYAEIDRSGKMYSLKNLKATVAGSPVTGSASIDIGAAKPTVKMDLTFTDLAIQSGGAATTSAPREGGKWSTLPMDTAWMNQYEADISVKANSLNYQSWDMQKPVIEAALHGGKLNVSKLTAGLFGGQMDVTANMAAGADNKGFGAVDTTAKFANVDVGALTKAFAGSYVIKGKGSMNMDMTASTAGASQAALISALKGQGTMNGKNIVLDGFDLTKFTGALTSGKPLDRLGGLQGAFSGGSTAFDTMDGSYTISQGIVNITKLLLDGTQASVSTTGNVNLPQWTIDTTNTISLKPQAVAQAATQQQGAAAAANVKTPPPFTVKVAGSLDNPGQTFGQGLIQNYINSQITDKLDSAISKKLGLPPGLLGGQQPTAPAQAPATTQNAAPNAMPNAAPAAGDAAQQTQQQPTQDQTQPLSKKDQKKQQINNLINGLLGH